MAINKTDLAIFHFLPIEGYPPIQNLLNILEENPGLNVFCVTTLGNFPFKVKSKNIKIFRFVRLHKIPRFVGYSTFNILGFFLLLYKRPRKILYFETTSSFPVLYFAKFFPKTKVYIHYHEYVTKEEYRKGSPIIRYYHRLEKNFYKRVQWISQTNKQRLDRFCNDIGLGMDNRFHILPNYPPLKWWEGSLNKSKASLPHKLVYVGYSLDFGSMFAKEVIDWVTYHPKLLSLDLYLFKIDSEVKIYADNKKSPAINWHKALPYNELPPVLKKYDTGLILYKGLVDNYVFNAPNKLFEYLACGLNVMYSDRILGIEPYRSSYTLPVDFEKIEKIDIKNLIKGQREFSGTKYFAEDALTNLIRGLDFDKVSQ